MGQGGWPCQGRHWGAAQHSQQECYGLALHCTHRERAQAKAWAVLRSEGAAENSSAGNPGAAHSTSKAVLLPPGRQLHSPKQGDEKLSSLSSAKKGTTECNCICSANATTELSIPQGDHSTELDAEISDIFQRT